MKAKSRITKGKRRGNKWEQRKYSGIPKELSREYEWKRRKGEGKHRKTKEIQRKTTGNEGTTKGLSREYQGRTKGDWKAVP